MSPKLSSFSGVPPGAGFVHERYLQELLSTLAPRKSQDSTWALYPLGLGALEFVLSFCLGKCLGKVLGKPGTNTVGHRATNTCVKNTEGIEKRKRKNLKGISEVLGMNT